MIWAWLGESFVGWWQLWGRLYRAGVMWSQESVSRRAAEFWIYWSLFRTRQQSILDAMKSWIKVSAAEKESDGWGRAFFFSFFFLVRKRQFCWFVSGNVSSSHYTSMAYSKYADVLHVHIYHFHHLMLACEQADIVPYHGPQIVAETKDNIIIYAGSKSKDKVLFV